MRLLTFAADDYESFGAVGDAGVVDIGAKLDCHSIRQLLEESLLQDAEDIASSSDPDFALDEIDYLPTIPNPQKIVCIGVNYGKRNEEYRDDTETPKYPSVFMRTRESLVGHRAPILKPPESAQLDYEGEIAIVIGKPGRRIPVADAWDYIAGFTLMNEGSVRDWLRHAKFNVTQGKNFASSGSLGPWMVTADEFDIDAQFALQTSVNGELRQDDTTDNLIFPFRYLIGYLSTFMHLKPGDVIATGTPTGAGARFDPPKYLHAGDVVEVVSPSIGMLSNRVEDEVVEQSERPI
jgi:2-keto-4-pentenoate hydratase/2-oxohepta-3-ene-1,7-dioic acid hydratase in catechol pathway